MMMMMMMMMIILIIIVVVIIIIIIIIIIFIYWLLLCFYYYIDIMMMIVGVVIRLAISMSWSIGSGCRAPRGDRGTRRRWRFVFNWKSQQWCGSTAWLYPVIKHGSKSAMLMSNDVNVFPWKPLFASICKGCAIAMHRRVGIKIEKMYSICKSYRYRLYRYVICTNMI